MEDAARTEDVLSELRKIESLLQYELSRNDTSSKKKILLDLKKLNDRLLSSGQKYDPPYNGLQSRKTSNFRAFKILELIMQSAISGLFGLCIAGILGFAVLNASDNNPFLAEIRFMGTPIFLKAAVIFGASLRLLREVIKPCI